MDNDHSMRAMETTPAASLNAGEDLALVERTMVYGRPPSRADDGIPYLSGLTPLRTQRSLSSFFLDR